MDPQFEELAVEIARLVEDRLKGHFDKSEDRVKTHFDESEDRVKKHFDESEERVRKHFDESEDRVKKHFDESEDRVRNHFDESEERVRKHLDEFEARAELRMKMHFENLDYTVKLAAEGYGATLDRIERDVAELKSSTTTGFADITRVLENHAQRIETIEESTR